MSPGLLDSIKVAFNRTWDPGCNTVVHSRICICMWQWQLKSAHLKLSYHVVHRGVNLSLFGKWRSTACRWKYGPGWIENTSTLPDCIYFSLSPQPATHSNHVTVWVSVIILWLVLNGNGMHNGYPQWLFLSCIAVAVKWDSYGWVTRVALFPNR